MPTVHFVYPCGPQIYTPHAIGRKVSEHLRHRGYAVRNYDWKERVVMRPERGDILLGHAEFSSATAFRANMRNPHWARKVAMFPFQSGDLWQSAFAAHVIPHCDSFLAICGHYWFERLPQSPLAHVAPRTRHLDLAVDRNEFPFIKTNFNPPGQRRFLYVGNSSPYKNPGYLRALAGARPDWTFSWIGSGSPLPELAAYGRRDFRDEASRALVAEHDFFITVGLADANPTTILEAMAWGLIPVCTPQSGYEGQAGIHSLPLHDLPAALGVLDRLQYLPESALRESQASNLAALDSHYNWERFGAQVAGAVEDRGAPAQLLRFRWRDRLRVLAAEFTSPYSPAPPMPWVRRWASRLRHRRVTGSVARHANRGGADS